jgi:phosphoglycolate phosphatase
MRRPLAGVTILFDLDGTLVDTAGDLAAAMNHALKEAGRAPVPLARVRHLVGHGARAMLAQGLRETGVRAPDAAELDALVAIFLEFYMAHIADTSRPFPGALDAIEAIRADGASVAICTNKREAWARALLDALALSPYFESIVGADTTGAAKPDKRPLQRCLADTGAKIGVFIGDSDTDIRAAEAAGMPCLVALFGYGPLDLCDQAFARFSNYDEVPALVGLAATRLA